MSIIRWLKLWFSLLLLLPLIASLNYYIDPFWLYNHSNSLNQIQKPFNERQQKTNYIYFNGFNYDGILLGSSRATYINQNDFGDMNIYNYAFNSSQPDEFNGYIEFAKELYKKELKYIVIGADFIGTKKGSVVKNRGSKTYVDAVKSFGYKYKTTLSITTLKESIKNMASSIKGSSRVYYTRENLKYKRDISDKKRFSKYKSTIEGRESFFSAKNYKYNENYIDAMIKMKKLNPNTEFTVYTSPIHINMLMSNLKNNKGRIEDYERWLRELISVFGKVEHFMTLSSVTSKLKNYPDAEHFYENVGKFIANKISKQYSDKIPNGFGITLTKENIDSYMLEFRDDVKKFELDISKHTF